MDVFEVVKTVLAIRAYQDKPVPQDVVRKIIESAHLTASSINKQPWYFILVENKDTLKKLGRLIKTGPYIAQAPMAVAVVIQDTVYAVSDASRAIQSMILTAWSEGVGSNWVGFHLGSDVKNVLSIPDNLDLLAIVPFGYPAQPAGAGKKKRKPLSEVVRRERFDQPYFSAGERLRLTKLCLSKQYSNQREEWNGLRPIS